MRALLPLFLLASCVGLAAQETIKSNTELVLIPVVAQKNGRSVTDLKKENFRVQENGKQQTILGFDLIEASATPIRQQAAQGGFTNAYDWQGGARRLTIVALDQLNTGHLDQAFAKRELLKFFSTQISGDQLFALVTMTSGGIRPVVDFTADPLVVKAAIEKVLSGTNHYNDIQKTEAQQSGLRDPITRENVPTQDGLEQYLQRLAASDDKLEHFDRRESLRLTLACFRQLAAFVAGVPGRKSLVWATAGFPFDLGDPEELSSSGLRDEYQRTFRLLNDSGLAVYPVDVRGLVVFANGSPMGADSNFRGDGRRLQNVINAGRMADLSLIQTMDEFADKTGGRAFRNTNDLAGAFGQATTESRTYYMLAYRPAANRKPGWQKLNVSVDRPGVQLRARTGYFFTDRPKEDKNSKRDEIRAALDSPLMLTALPFSVRWTGTEWKDEKAQVRFEVFVPGSVITIDPEDSNAVNFDILAVTLDTKDEGAQTLQTIGSKVKNPDEFRAQTVQYKNMLKLKAGDYKVRFIVRDNLNGRIGSLTVPLKVTPQS